MLVAEITRYGPPEVVRLVERPCPTPGPGEVLIRVRAAPVTAGDARIRSGKVPRGFATALRLAFGWRAPRFRPGWAFAGEVTGLGEGTTGVALGARVFGVTGVRGGAHAEYLVMPANGLLLPLPESLSLEEGAACFFGGLTAAAFLIDTTRVQPGERVLIHGATGAVGSAAVQMATHLRALVTAVASSPNHDLARRLGAVAVHDYRAGPVQGCFDVVLDVMGALGWRGARPLLADAGRLALVTADLPATLGALLWSRRDGRRVVAGTSKASKEKMQRVVDLHLAGAYRPVVGQVLPFSDLARAHALAETFHKPGNLVVAM